MLLTKIAEKKLGSLKQELVPDMPGLFGKKDALKTELERKLKHAMGQNDLLAEELQQCSQQGGVGGRQLGLLLGRKFLSQFLPFLET